MKTQGAAAAAAAAAIARGTFINYVLLLKALLAFKVVVNTELSKMWMHVKFLGCKG